MRVTIDLWPSPQLSNPSNSILKRRCSSLSSVLWVMEDISLLFKISSWKVTFTYNKGTCFKSAVGDNQSGYRALTHSRKFPMPLCNSYSPLSAPFRSDFYHRGLVLLVERLCINRIVHHGLSFVWLLSHSMYLRFLYFPVEKRLWVVSQDVDLHNREYDSCLFCPLSDYWERNSFFFFFFLLLWLRWRHMEIPRLGIESVLPQKHRILHLLHHSGNSESLDSFSLMRVWPGVQGWLTVQSCPGLSSWEIGFSLVKLVSPRQIGMNWLY